MPSTSPVPSTASISGISRRSSSRYRSARHPVTIKREQLPFRLCSAISRIASIDSSFALSMNAHVLTTRTSASADVLVSSCPASRASPSITSPSTRFFGQPKDRKPIFICRRQPPVSWVYPIQHSRIRNRLAEMLEAADPAHHTLDAHAEPAVRHAAVAAEIEVPLERFLRQFVFVDPLQQEIVVIYSHATADDFAITLGRQDVHTQRDVGALGIGFHVKRLHGGRVAVYRDRTIEFFRERCFVRCAEVPAPFERQSFS